MQANKLRHIRSGQEFNGYFPLATGRDTVIEASAGLDETITLMQRIVPETKSDTMRIAGKLKRDSLPSTCRAIWEFVYNHIQYKRDKTGIEQVRRPSRSWADRHKGVDCDCYTVFISSILMNLGIPHSIRITKYNGRPNFQHVYPIVPMGKGHITMDCVTDRFNYEVPFSAHRDYKMKDMNINMEGLSGVDQMDLGVEGLDALLQPRLPLRHNTGDRCMTINVNHQYPKKRFPKPQKQGIKRPPSGKGPFKKAVIRPAFSNSTGPKLFSGKQASKMTPKKSGSGAFINTLLVLGAGYATYKLFSSPKPKKRRQKRKSANNK